MDKKIEQEFKPRTWLLVILVIIALGITTVLSYKIITTIRENMEAENEAKLEEQRQKEKEEFNHEFEYYVGTNWKNIVDNVFDNIIDNNKKNSDKKVTLIYDSISTQDENEIVNIKNQLENFVDYEVSVDYDDDGYVNQVTIKRAIDKSSFNWKFETSAGTRGGISVRSTIDEVINSNKKEKEHQITIVYNDSSIQDEEELRNLKNEFDDFKSYEIILDYDENGFVNKITIR